MKIKDLCIGLKYKNTVGNIIEIDEIYKNEVRLKSNKWHKKHQYSKKFIITLLNRNVYKLVKSELYEIY